MAIAQKQKSVSRDKFGWKLITKIGAAIFIGLIISYLAISAYAGNTLTIPRRKFEPEKASVFSINPEEVNFLTADGLEIAGWFIPSTASDKALILVHGRNSSRTHEFGGEFPEFGAAMHHRGFSVLMIDMRGHGQSATARCTFGLSERRDVIAAVEWLKQQGYQTEKMGVLGVSMGAAAVVGAAADNPEIDVLVLDSGYAAVYPLVQSQWRSASGLPDFFLPSTLLFANWLTGFDLTSAQPAKEIEHMVARPILIIHSALDPETPVEHAYQLRAAAPTSEYWETAVAKHSRNYNDNPQVYIDIVADFLNHNLQ